MDTERVTRSYVEAIAAGAADVARGESYRQFRQQYPCPRCKGTTTDPDADLRPGNLFTAETDCRECGGWGIAFAPEGEEQP